MNYKIRITEENQAIVKRIADENEMNPHNFHFNKYTEYEITHGVFEFRNTLESVELTTEQFIELFDKKETELNKWLRETKAKNLKANELWNEIARLPMDISKLLEGDSITNKTHYLLTEWSNLTEESPKVETEWQPKRGDAVLVWDDSEDLALESIFLCNVEKAKLPIFTVTRSDEKEFLNNDIFSISCYKHMKSLPIKQPKETDFKTKVIELIEKNINDKQEKLKFVIDKNNLIYEAVLESIVEIQKNLLKQIKQL
jgi:hypothetical protein